MTPDFSVLEYLGKVGDGVLVMLSAVLDSEYHECTYYYGQGTEVLTLSEDLERAIADSPEPPGMAEMIAAVRKKVVPYQEISSRLDPVDFRRWETRADEGEPDPEEAEE